MPNIARGRSPAARASHKDVRDDAADQAAQRHLGRSGSDVGADLPRACGTSAKILLES
ncbi:protein of unknown function [Thauera humireducens]|nr:protein of unknown function [Thauera humireducens]